MLNMIVEICFISVSVSQIESLLLTCSCRPISKYNEMIQSELKENATRYQPQRCELVLCHLLIG